MLLMSSSEVDELVMQELSVGYTRSEETSKKIVLAEYLCKEESNSSSWKLLGGT